jgi:hypothetical protein
MDINLYIKNLDSHSESVLNRVENYSDAELSYQPSGGWNVMGILEHILVTEGIVLKLLTRPTEKTHTGDEVLGHDKLHRLMINLRGRKVEAPDALKPKGALKTTEEFKKNFLEQRELLKTNLREGKIIVDNRTHRHAFLGEMTITDWLNFIHLHTQRHSDQMEELVEGIRKNNLQ